MKIKEYSFADGKYEIHTADDGSTMVAYRYGEVWQDMVGDKLIVAVLDYIDNLEITLDYLNEKEMERYFTEGGQD